LIASLLLFACPPDNPELQGIVRFWEFTKFVNGAVGETPVGDDHAQVGGVVNDTSDFGPLVLFPPLAGPDAKAEVFSNETGFTYWVSTQAPSTVLAPGAVIGSSASLIQFQYFRKTKPDATLRVVVSKALLEAIDENGGVPTRLECPWHRPGGNFFDCLRTMWAWVDFNVEGFSFVDQRTFFKTGGFAELGGYQRAWTRDAYTHGDAMVPFWNNASFGFEDDIEGDGGGHAVAYLAQPITLEVPLSSVGVGDLFYLQVTAEADAVNHRQRESYLSAYFRDPQQADGLAFTYDGLEPVATPAEKPAPTTPLAAPACTTGADPTAGTLQFDADAYENPELPGDGATIVVTRSGGSHGAVSVLLSTSDGTAAAGSDYTPVTTQVLFADGEEGSRAVRIPIVTDDVSEPDKTVNLTLSDPNGCAALGAQTTATLTIMDDDRPIVLDNFSVGGTVTGLVGTGLVLSEIKEGLELSPGNGPFTFGGPGRPTGFDYEVRVTSQPVNPFQVCTVENGVGTIAGANVTDVTVTCVTPEQNGALDPGFGGGGKATAGLPGGAFGMALQGDGKIVLVGGLTMVRYNADGTLDSDFGTGGVIPIAFNAGLLDVADGVTVQPDGKIVVVGATRVGMQDDFAVNRYDTHGALDPSFGAGGKVSTDFAGSTDRAYAVRIQSDDKIVVAGHAAQPSAIGGDNDFAVARYTAAGALDAGFGTGGKVTTNIAGRTDLAYAAELQPDGKIVVAGRVADGGGDDPDVGLVRYNADGSPDMGFGDKGIVRKDLTLGGWDEASGIVLQRDGKIVVSVQAAVGPTFVFAAARFLDDGNIDGGFGASGLATAALSTKNDYAHAIALQANDEIVVVGQSSNLMAPDFGIARFTSQGALDTGFGTEGKLTVDFFSSSDGAECVAVQPDGKIVVGGFARNGASTGLGLARVLP
jgi:uncharacterized delta-60 repeat protein